MRYPIPPASADAWRQYQRGQGVRNPSLLFDRFLPDLSHHKETDAKKKALKSLSLAMSKADQSLLMAWQARFKVGVRATHATPFIMESDWRFVTGLGRKGALEVGFTFHRYGFPILPGSSVKGIARASAHQLEGLDENEAALPSDADFVTIGGFASDQNEAESQAGSAIFYDAIPAELPKLELDVITPHFAEYYQKEKWPTDSQNPIPIPFLTVAPNTTFLFAVGWRGAMDEEALRLRELAQTWLINGLEILGAGAKTSAGYGFFAAGALLAEEEEPEAAPELAVDPDEVRITQLIQQIEVIPSNKVAGEIHAYYQQWRDFDGREELKERLAIAICKRVESSSFRKNANKRKRWYQTLKASLPEGVLK
jgi:CRISPR-associated protein Cmr6